MMKPIAPRVLAWELAQSSIAVNELTPGLTTTPGIGVFGDVVPVFLVEAARQMDDWITDPDDVGRFALKLVGLPTDGTTRTALRAGSQSRTPATRATPATSGGSGRTSRVSSTTAA